MDAPLDIKPADITPVDMPKSGEAGFSLLETLFALAIMSLASLALFQSTSAMLSLSDRAVKAGERTVNSTLERRALNHLVDGLLPGWPETEEAVFTGSPRGFNGISTGAPRQGVAAPMHFEVKVETLGQNGAAALTYRAIAEGRFADKGNDDDRWVLRGGFPAGAQLSYMGVDHEFYDNWPPKNIPSRGYFDDDTLMRLPPLPEAIRLTSANGVTLWTATAARTRTLPVRFDPLAGL